MTYQAHVSAADGLEPGHRVAQLREVLCLVERLAGRSPAPDAGMDEAARTTGAYGRALPVTQRRFDAMAGEAAAWAAAGVEALLAGGGAPPRAAAARLADRLDAALGEMAGMLR